MLLHSLLLLLLRQEMKGAVSPSNNGMLTMKLWTWTEGEMETQWSRVQNSHNLICTHQHCTDIKNRKRSCCLQPTHACVAHVNMHFLLQSEVNVCVLHMWCQVEVQLHISRLSGSSVSEDIQEEWSHLGGFNATEHPGITVWVLPGYAEKNIFVLTKLRHHCRLIWCDRILLETSRPQM